MRRIRTIFIIALFLALVASAKMQYGTSGTQRRHFKPSCDLTFTFTNADELIKTIHDGLSSHASSFTISYRASDSDFDAMKKLTDELMTCAMYNTDSPIEGDYVRYQYGGYRLSFGKNDDPDAPTFRLVITPVYYSTVEEEQEVDEKVSEIIGELSFYHKTSDREKISAVYDYICSHVKYDFVHVNSSHYHKDSTAYAALVQNYASCQGYAVAVFRLLKELGIECEVVTGTGIDETGKSEFHAWNKVRLDGTYYTLDATWDAGKDEYNYFLKSEEAIASTHIQSGE